MSSPEHTRPTWGEVIGQSAVTETLRAALRSDELAHAWLFVGPSGVGQAAVARALAAALNCPESEDPAEGCGTCSVCSRIARGTHPAVRDFEPEGAFHVVDAVREDWLPVATRTQTEGRRKVLRVVSAERMNEAAQNAFLKILEEPPPSVVWLLDAEDDAALLDTIVSRCRRLDFVAWGPEALAELAGRLGVDAADRPVLARAALGSPARLRALTDPEVAAARQRHLSVIGRLADEGPGVVVPVATELVGWAKSRSKAAKEHHAEEMERLEESYGVEDGRGWPPGVKQRLTKRFERLEREEQRRAYEMVLDDLASWLRDCLAAGSGASEDALINLDQIEQLRIDAGRLGAPSLVSGLEAIETCREALDRNGQPQVQLERLLMHLALPLYTSAA